MNTLAQAPVITREVRIPSGDARLYGDLTLPASGPALGLVLFAHGSGSGRHSARNRRVAQRLQQSGMGTLLFDLLTAQEEQSDVHTSEHSFDMAPTLLIVGGADHGVIELNEESLKHLNCEKSLVIVPGATHLFEERGALEQVGELAASWFASHLPQHSPAQPTPANSKATQEDAP